jgi:hypothetical protein
MFRELKTLESFDWSFNPSIKKKPGGAEPANVELIERHQIRPTEAPVAEARSPQRLVDAAQKGLGPVVFVDLIRLDHDDLPTKESTCRRR